MNTKKRIKSLNYESINLIDMAKSRKEELTTVIGIIVILVGIIVYSGSANNFFPIFEDLIDHLKFGRIIVLFGFLYLIVGGSLWAKKR